MELTRHGRWRGVRSTAPIRVRLRSHFKDEFAAVGDVGVAEPWFVPWLVVQRGGLDVEIFLGVIPCLDDQVFAIAQMHDGFVKERRADDVVRT